MLPKKLSSWLSLVVQMLESVQYKHLKGHLRSGRRCVHGCGALQGGRRIQRLHGRQSRRVLCGTACGARMTSTFTTLHMLSSPS